MIQSCIVLEKCDDHDNKSLDCVIMSTGSVMRSHDCEKNPGKTVFFFRVYIRKDFCITKL